MSYLDSINDVRTNLLYTVLLARDGGMLIFSNISTMSLARDDGLLIFSLPRHWHWVMVYQDVLYPQTNKNPIVKLWQIFNQIQY